MIVPSAIQFKIKNGNRHLQVNIMQIILLNDVSVLPVILIKNIKYLKYINLHSIETKTAKLYCLLFLKLYNLCRKNELALYQLNVMHTYYLLIFVQIYG